PGQVVPHATESCRTNLARGRDRAPALHPSALHALAGVTMLTRSTITELHTDTIDSEIGPIVIVTRPGALCAVDFAECGERMKTLLSRRFEDFALVHEDNPLGVSEKLLAYFAKDYAALDDVVVDTGGTEFQRRVWVALRAIPPGSTRTYGELASPLGGPTASPAAGLGCSASGSAPPASIFPMP